jgi:hypothetical protein
LQTFSENAKRNAIWHLVFNLYTLPIKKRHQQGDQIGQIFASWATVYFWAVFLITEESQIFVQLLSTIKVV